MVGLRIIKASTEIEYQQAEVNRTAHWWKLHNTPQQFYAVNILEVLYAKDNNRKFPNSRY